MRGFGHHGISREHTTESSESDVSLRSMLMSIAIRPVQERAQLVLTA